MCVRPACHVNDGVCPVVPAFPESEGRWRRDGQNCREHKARTRGGRQRRQGRPKDRCETGGEGQQDAGDVREEEAVQPQQPFLAEPAGISEEEEFAQHVAPEFDVKDTAVARKAQARDEEAPRNHDHGRVEKRAERDGGDVLKRRTVFHG